MPMDQDVHIQNFRGKHIFFIGIGGSSMSGLAMILKDSGYQISGSDMQESAITQNVRQSGIPRARRFAGNVALKEHPLSFL